MLIHWPDHETPFDETMRGLDQLKADGKIRHYGVSNFDGGDDEGVRSSTGHLAANQVGYHMFDRRMEREVLPYCAETNTGYMAYGSLGFGLLSGRVHAGDDVRGLGLAAQVGRRSGCRCSTADAVREGAEAWRSG